jgi:MFS family permease
VLAYAFGVFLVPMRQELGWSRTALTGAYALAIIVSGVAAIPVGRWLDRHGARTLMTTGAGAASLLVLAWAQVSDLAVFYAIWVGIGLAMAAVCCTSPRSRSLPAGTATPPIATGPCSA